jgi:hypothetical protein
LKLILIFYLKSATCIKNIRHTHLKNNNKVLNQLVFITNLLN